MRFSRSLFWLVLAVGGWVLWTRPVWASPSVQETPPQALLWSYLGGGLALFIPSAVILWVASGLTDKERARAALLIPLAVGLTVAAYAAVGFAFEFGGVGLLDARHGFSQLVWEWSALPEQWGPYWGMAGFAGWFLRGGAGSPEAVALFVGHVPWVLTAVFIPLLVLRNRVPSPVPLVVALVAAGIVVPVAGNWVHGGGWLARLGATLGWGHGYVDVGGSGLVGLVGGGMGLALLLAFRLRPLPEDAGEPPRVTDALLAAMAMLFLAIGTVGWALNNPLYDVAQVPLHRVLVNGLLGVAGGAFLPALYIWFVRGEHHPHFPLAGAFAGWVSSLAGLPFLPPWATLGVALTVGFLTPLLLYVVREKLRLDDPAGVVTAALVGGWAGPLAVGLFADGMYGLGWNAIGRGVYQGVKGQGVSGLWVPTGYAADWPGQMYAQLTGAAAHFFWAFLLTTLLGVGISMLVWGIRRLTQARVLVQPSSGEASSGG